MDRYLDVPVAEKDEAKRLGARWDPRRRRWFVPDGVDGGAFARWLPCEPRRGGRWMTARVWFVPEPCWKCGQRGAWPIGVTLAETVGEHIAGMLVEIAFCAEAIAAAVSPEWLAGVGAGPIEFRHSRTLGEAVWTNTCRGCGGSIGSRFLVHELLHELASEGLSYEDLPSWEFEIPTGSL